MTVPAILISGPFAGYVLGHFIFEKYLGMPAVGVLLFAFAGFLASGLQVYRIIQRIRQLDLDSKEKPGS